jgi:molybdopterin-guanine dinucleotide biosynthesis protein A
MDRALVFGILVGGAGTRMGGLAKGLLKTPHGKTILQHLLALCETVKPAGRVVLLGQHPAYAAVPLPQLADDPAGIGPLGGLRALLLDAASHASDALILGCDLPHLSAALLTRLAAENTAPAVSVRLDGFWNPVFARYQPAVALPVIDAALAKNQQSMARILDTLGATALACSDAERAALRDWDTPEDVAR